MRGGKREEDHERREARGGKRKEGSERREADGRQMRVGAIGMVKMRVGTMKERDCGDAGFAGDFFDGHLRSDRLVVNQLRASGDLLRLCARVCVCFVLG